MNFSRPEIVDIPEPIFEATAHAEERGSVLRAKQRVAARHRGTARFAWKNRWVRILAVLAVILGVALAAAACWEAKSLLLRNSHFILASAEEIQVSGNRVVRNREALAVFAPDLGHSIFQVPLAKRRAQLQQIDWVRTATVMRLWPNRLRMILVERTPVAFARDGNTVRLVDDEGVLLDLLDAVAQHYSFPVLSGISSSDPISTRAARMSMSGSVQALNADGGHVAATLSEVDVSDPEDIRAVFAGGPHTPIVHFGDANFLARYRAYQAHLTEWLQRYPQLRSIDMRYGKQVVLDVDPSAVTAASQTDGSTAVPVAPDAGKSHAISSSATNAPKVKSRAATRHRTMAHPRKSSGHAVHPSSGPSMAGL